MPTITKIGPADHGRRMTFEEYSAGDYEPGHKYELIDGNLYVSPEANLPELCDEEWLLDKLKAYAREHPEILNFVTNKARVFVPGRLMVTVPEPDLAGYRHFPRNRPIRELRWQDVSPILIAEILTEGDPGKDLVRNVELYLRIPSVREYWILDTRENPDEPTMTVHRRHGQRWRTSEIAFGETYTTRLLPGFELLLDPHR
ncbi:MAG: Uma2 family endonuclease [Gemmataceae bacterium]|nr:Uma2 family endonuclease [Gemmataceae bacterium]